MSSAVFVFAMRGSDGACPLVPPVYEQGNLCTSRGTVEPIPWCRRCWPRYLLSTHSVWAGSAEHCVSQLCSQLMGWTSPTSTARVVGGFDGTTRAAQGKISPCLEACYRMVSGLTGEKGSCICPGSAHACKITLAQICTHSLCHGCVGMSAEQPCDPRSTLSLLVLLNPQAVHAHAASCC